MSMWERLPDAEEPQPCCECGEPTVKQWEFTMFCSHLIPMCDPCAGQEEDVPLKDRSE